MHASILSHRPVLVTTWLECYRFFVVLACIAVIVALLIWGCNLVAP